MATGWRDDPRELLRAEEDYDLKGMKRDATPGWKAGKKSAERFCQERSDLLSELQERLFAEGHAGGKRSLLVVVVDPQGVALRSFGAPG